MMHWEGGDWDIKCSTIDWLTLRCLLSHYENDTNTYRGCLNVLYYSPFLKFLKGFV
jgi:hypothetical protein